MKFKTLEIYNFKSFKGKHVFNIGDFDVGLHFVIGINQSEPELGANGAGKSTLFDALFWVLYGRTPRGLRGPSVSTWSDGKGTRVSIEAEISSDTFIITRERDPNRLSINERIVEQAEIDRLVGLGPEEFLQSVLIPQFGNMFFDMSPADKLTLFAQVLGLQRWVDHSRQASEEVKEVESDLHAIDIKVARYESSIQTLSESAISFLRRRDEFKKEIEVEADTIKSQIDKNVVTILDLEEDNSDHKEVVEGYEVELEEALVQHEANIEVLEQLEEQLRTLELNLHLLTQHAVEAEEDLAMFEEVGFECVYCKQPVSGEHKTRVKSELGAKLKEAKADAKKESTAKERLERKIGKAEGRCTVTDSLCDDIRRRIDALQKTIVENKADIEDRTKINGQLHSKRVEILKKTNPYQDEVTKIESDIKQMKSEMKKLLTQHKDLSAIKEALAYWIKGFKEIRLFQIKEALTQLEVEVNNNLIQMGLRGWEIRFDVERETKSGSISKGFQVLIASPDHSEVVPWEAWSGGESQRLRLAGTMGLASLILDSRGIKPNIEVYDEPSAHLSHSGIEDLVDLLYSRARSQDKQVWLVDHRSLDYGGFASVTTIMKDSEGSQIATEYRTGE